MSPFLAAFFYSQKMDIKAVIFDLDGVLLNSESAWQAAIAETVKSHGKVWTKKDRDSMSRHMKPSGWSSYIKERSKIEAKEDEVRRDVLQRMRDIYRNDLPLMPGAKETVEDLAQIYPLALATGSDREIVDLFLEQSGLGGSFLFSLAAEDTISPKPDPEIYKKAADVLSFQPEEILVVEDSEEGILAAKAAGMQAICYLDEEMPPSKETLAEVNLVLRDLRALRDILLWPSRVISM